jgi:hypothetical protein
MKTGKTPETDYVMDQGLWGGGRSLTLSRKLERERDQLRNLLSTVLKFGLTDQVKAEAENFLRESK